MHDGFIPLAALARNLAQFPFLSRADDSVRAEIEKTLHENVLDLSLGGQLTVFSLPGS